MKNGMKTKASLGKTSTFLMGLKKKNIGLSQTRRIKRMHTDMPSSSKIGAGGITAIRKFGMGSFRHRKNHRDNSIIGAIA